MDLFAQLLQRQTHQEQMRELAEALRQLPIANADAQATLNTALDKLIAPKNREPEIQRKITEFTFTEPALSIQDIAGMEKYRPMKPGTHIQDDDSVIYYNSRIQDSDYVDPEIFAIQARTEDQAAHPERTAAQLQQVYDTNFRAQTERNVGIFAQPPNWVLIKRKAQNDTRLEDSLLQYSDKKHTHVDWYNTINTLKETGTAIGYTRQHYKRVLTRFVSYFKPEMSQVAQRLNIDELARILMTSTMPSTETEMLLEEIKKLTRKTGETLRVPMSSLYSLATSYYGTAIGAEDPQITRILFNGLQHFTTGTTREQLQKLIKHSQLHKIKLDYHDVLQTCIETENNTGIPTTDLTFGQ